jgi:Fe-S-cluster containining protein
MAQKTIDPVKEFNFGRVSEVEINAEEGEDPYITVNYHLPIPGFDSRAEIEEVFYLNKERNVAIREAVNNLYSEIEKAIKNGQNVEGNPCSTCTSRCCNQFHDSIVVTHNDLERIGRYLGESMDWVKDHFIPIKANDPVLFGRARSKHHQGEQYCVFFDTDKRNCGIHPVKPQVCRDFSPHNCQLWESDSFKVMKNFMAKQKAKAKKQGTHRGPVAVPRKKRKK